MALLTLTRDTARKRLVVRRLIRQHHILIYVVVLHHLLGCPLLRLHQLVGITIKGAMRPRSTAIRHR